MDTKILELAVDLTKAALGSSAAIPNDQVSKKTIQFLEDTAKKLRELQQKEN